MLNTRIFFNHIVAERSWFAAALVSFFLPFYIGWSTITLVVLFLVMVSDSNARKRLLAFKSYPMLYPFILFYIVYFISILYSANVQEGLRNMSSMIAFLLLPVCISALDFAKRENINRVMLSFTAGCLSAGVACLAVAFNTWYRTGGNHFFYTEFSIFMHPSYFALMLDFGLCYLYSTLIFERTEKRKKPLIVFVIVLSNVLIVLLMSKAGIFTAMLVQVLVFVRALGKRVNRTRAVFVFLAMTISAIALYKILVPANQERITDSEQQILTKPLPNTSSESTGLRLLIWKSTWPLIKDNFLFGLGVGDVQDELTKVYQEKGITVAMDKRLNTHNQYLQTILSSGLPGLIFLLLLLLLPLRDGIRKRNFLLWMFPVITGFNFLFESMLERQAGIVFFAFFMALLMLANAANRNLLQDKHLI